MRRGSWWSEQDAAGTVPGGAEQSDGAVHDALGTDDVSEFRDPSLGAWVQKRVRSQHFHDVASTPRPHDIQLDLAAN